MKCRRLLQHAQTVYTIQLSSVLHGSLQCIIQVYGGGLYTTSWVVHACHLQGGMCHEIHVCVSMSEARAEAISDVVDDGDDKHHLDHD